MPDLYPSMTALQAATVRGLDWDIYTVDNNHDVLISSIHGGGIEVGTSELNILTRELGGYDSFIFEALRTLNNAELHVTSVNYDEPTMVSMVTDAKQHVAIHGASGDTAVINVGGLDLALRNTIWSELTARGFNAQIAPPEIIGEQLDNVSNRNKNGGCCQLEISTKQRQDFFVDGDWSRAKRSDRANWTPALYSFAQAIVAGIEKTRNTYPQDRYTSYLMNFNNNLNFGGTDDLAVRTIGNRLVHLRLSLANGVPTVIYRKGADFVANLEPDASGIKVTFKNIPSNTVPFMEFMLVSSEGFKTTSGTYANYQYMRQYNSNFLLIGMKEWSNVNTHISMADIASGVAEIKIHL